MKSPERITIALDEETTGLFKKMKEDLGMSQSELMRASLKFFSKHKSLFEFAEDKKVYTHAEMLSAGEHVILDIDHWILFLNFIETHPDKEKFWKFHKDVCQAHAEQFKHKLYNAESILQAPGDMQSLQDEQEWEKRVHSYLRIGSPQEVREN